LSKKTTNLEDFRSISLNIAPFIVSCLLQKHADKRRKKLKITNFLGNQLETEKQMLGKTLMNVLAQKLEKQRTMYQNYQYLK
jgi:hypothetical protein